MLDLIDLINIINIIVHDIINMQCSFPEPFDFSSPFDVKAHSKPTQLSKKTLVYRAFSTANTRAQKPQQLLYTEKIKVKILR